MSEDKKVEGFEDTIRWYDQNAKTYAQTIELRPNLEQIEEFVSLLPHNAKILDAGCAGGRDTKLLKDKGIDVIGVDLSPELIKIAKEKYPDIKFVEGNFLHLPFDTNSFDGIWAHQSLVNLETTDDVIQAFLEFHRLLKDDGVLHILVKAQTGSQKTAIVSDSFSQHDRFFQYFTKEEIKELLEKSGFEITKIEQYKETDKDPKGRPEVELIYSLSKKKPIESGIADSNR